MAVFTEVSFDEAAAFLSALDLGHLRTIEACSVGIENINYFVDTEAGAYVHDAVREAAFLAACESAHRLLTQERHLLPAMKRTAALRFWLSRLRDLHLPRPAAVLKAHDPGHFERVLRERVAAQAEAEMS